MEITKTWAGFSLAITLLILSSCATHPKLTDQQILDQQKPIAELKAAVQKARRKLAHLLAPQSYARAEIALKDALDLARGNNIKAADNATSQGMKEIDKMQKDATNNSVILAEVLQVRKRAYAAQADQTYPADMKLLDNELRRTSILLEKGRQEEAKQFRPELITRYANLELTALKKSTSDLAKDAIAQAKQQEAQEYSPKTLKLSEEMLTLALTMLEADRTQVDKAEDQARRAKWLAQKSTEITETIKDFERREYTPEDIVLWHQQQLSTVNQPLGEELPFNKPAEQAVEALQTAVRNLMIERNIARDQRQKTEQKTKAQLMAVQEKYGKQLESSQKQRQIQMQKEREEKKRFASIQAMFNASEANVFRQRSNVLISAHGFKFLSGQSEIEAGNFPLMTKITRAIRSFPGARIEVSGHTDSTGADATNQFLSESRAEKVSRFLTDVGNIAPIRITSRGFGESRPVATNQTSKGRAENRRVEIKIINE